MCESNETTLKKRFSVSEIMFYVYKTGTHYNNLYYLVEYEGLCDDNDEIHERFAEKGQ